MKHLTRKKEKIFTTQHSNTSMQLCIYNMDVLNIKYKLYACMKDYAYAEERHNTNNHGLTIMPEMQTLQKVAYYLKDKTTEELLFGLIHEPKLQDLLNFIFKTTLKQEKISITRYLVPLQLQF